MTRPPNLDVKVCPRCRRFTRRVYGKCYRCENERKAAMATKEVTEQQRADELREGKHA